MKKIPKNVTVVLTFFTQGLHRMRSSSYYFFIAASIAGTESHFWGFFLLYFYVFFGDEVRYFKFEPFSWINNSDDPTYRGSVHGWRGDTDELWERKEHDNRIQHDDGTHLRR